MSETCVEVRQKSAVLPSKDGARYLVEISYQSSADGWDSIRSSLGSLTSDNSQLQRQIELYIASSRYVIQNTEQLLQEAIAKLKENPPVYLIRCWQCSELTDPKQITEHCLRCGYLCQPCAKEHSWVVSVLQGGKGDAQ
jgi:hypothetical protein